MYSQFRDIERGEVIIVGGDCSAGGGDWSVSQFYSKTKLDVPLVYRSKELASVMTTDLHSVLNKIFDATGVRPRVGYERNNGGFFEMERLATLNRENKYDLFVMPSVGSVEPTQGTKYGWDTNSATRPEMLATLKEHVDKGLITIYDSVTIDEMFSFIVAQTSASWKAQAERGAHDDHVMSLAIALKIAEMTPDSYSQTEAPLRVVGYQEGFGGTRIPIYQ